MTMIILVVIRVIQIHTSDSASDNELMGHSDNLIMMNEKLKKYLDASLFVPKSYFTFNKACYVSRTPFSVKRSA